MSADLTAPGLAPEPTQVDRFVEKVTRNPFSASNTEYALVLRINELSARLTALEAENERLTKQADKMMCAAIEMAIHALDAQTREGLPRYAHVVDYAGICNAVAHPKSVPLGEHPREVTPK